ncbi:LytTR family DNA-binding domain-containing protein [Tenacibaculum sp. FZY0031]|uniref:LytTR family DNA-binding domain-containing protein n=1 Tax=Tenacibaculum sp. FZY0031 TaxID=3116648 RepID=UPI002EC6BCA7|nr:LytTR family DNA-binding domain-containing protein [Tenacibaculum sp. FZY0031]
MKSKFLKNLSKPYPYLFHTKRNLIIAFILSIVTLLLNYYVTQNTLPNNLSACLTASIVTFLSILFFTELVPIVFFTAEIKENWNTVREFFFTLGILISIALFQNSFLYPFKSHMDSSFFLSLINTFSYVILVGTLPVLIIIWINYVIILKENLRSIKAYNKELEKELKQKDKEVVLSIKTNNVNETLILDLTTFLFAKSEGNYVDIYTKNLNSVDIKPYRISIQKLLNDLSDYSFILSTHRSYIINIKNIRRTSGNARNYKISFPDISHEVPVSRSKFKLFKEEFDKYYK